MLLIEKITLVHKGNILITESAFKKWGYELAANKFKDYVFTSAQYDELVETKGSEYANPHKMMQLNQKVIIKM